MQDISSIYKQLAPEVFRYAMFHLHNKEQAEDITSETFERLMKGQDIAQIENLKAWVFTIARNCIYTKYRQTPKQISLDNMTDTGEESFAEPVDMDINVESKAISAELIELIKNELDRFDDLTREVIILKVWEQFTFAEIAELTKLKEASVKLRYYRGLEKLKLNLGEKKGKKTYAVSIPIILAGIAKIALQNQFTLTAKLAANASLSNLNLSISQNPMQRFIQHVRNFLARCRNIFVTNSQVRLVILLTGVTCFVGLIGLIVYLYNRNLPPFDQGGSHSSSTVSTGTTSTDTLSKVEQYKARFQLAVKQDGEVYLSTTDQKDKLKLTDSQGKVQDFLVSPDRKTVVYTISEPNLITPIAESMEAKIISTYYNATNVPNATQRQQQIDITKGSLDRNLTTKIFKYDVETSQTSLLVDFAPFDANSASYTVAADAWHDNGIQLGAFKDDSSQLAYVRRGVWAVSLDGAQSKQITWSFDNPATDVDLCLSVGGIIWKHDVFSANRMCYEWAEAVLINTSNNQFVAVDPLIANLSGSHIGFIRYVADVDDLGHLLVRTKDYHMDGQGTMTVPELKLELLSFPDLKLVSTLPSSNNPVNTDNTYFVSGKGDFMTLIMPSEQEKVTGVLGYLYKLNTDNQWVELQKLTTTGLTKDDYFSSEFEVEGNSILISESSPTYNSKGNLTNVSKVIYLYDLGDNTLQTLLKKDKTPQTSIEWSDIGLY